MMCLVKSLFGKTMSKLESVSTLVVVHLLFMMYNDVTYFCFRLKQCSLRYKYSTLTRNMTKHTIQKTKQKMNCKLILTYKRILLVRFTCSRHSKSKLEPTLQELLLTSTSCKFSRGRQDPSSCFVFFKNLQFLNLYLRP